MTSYKYLSILYLQNILDWSIDLRLLNYVKWNMETQKYKNLAQ